MGVARGIQYLHTGGVLGNDLKIDNILLDDTLTARISSYNINLPSKVKFIQTQDTCIHCKRKMHMNSMISSFHQYRLAQKVLINKIPQAVKIQRRKIFISWELFLLRLSLVNL